MGGDLLKPGWLAEELAEVELEDARAELAQASALVPIARRNAEMTVGEACQRLRIAQARLQRALVAVGKLRSHPTTTTEQEDGRHD